jgi:hypothetical protein
VTAGALNSELLARVAASEAQTLLSSDGGAVMELARADARLGVPKTFVLGAVGADHHAVLLANETAAMVH